MEQPTSPAALIASAVPPAGPQPKKNYEDSNLDFAIPDGFDVPDGVKPGDDFQALGTFKIKDDSTMCLVAVDGEQVKVPERKPEPPPPAPPATMQEAIKKGMPA